MGRVGVTITKSVTFRGSAQEFGNTYYYDVIGTPNSTVANEIIDALVTKEKTIHSIAVTYVRAKAWSAGGTQAQNEMLQQKNLSGTGALTAHTSMDKERAVLVRLRAGVDSLSRPVYLRKWFHIDATVIGGSSITNGQLQNTEQLSSTQRTAMVNFANDIKSLTLVTQGFTQATLISKNGRSITGDSVCHPYLEHHQLGEMWR